MCVVESRLTRGRLFQIPEGEKEKAEAQMPLEGEAAKDNASLNIMEQKSQEGNQIKQDA